MVTEQGPWVWGTTRRKDRAGEQVRLQTLNRVAPSTDSAGSDIAVGVASIDAIKCRGSRALMKEAHREESGRLSTSRGAPRRSWNT
ncbi:MAG: hypothetical protein ABFD97_23395 [Syntrophobacter sp.]